MQPLVRSLFLIGFWLTFTFAVPADTESSWITYTDGVHRYSAEFVPNKSDVILGEPVWVTLRIVNIGAVPFQTDESPFPPVEFGARGTLTDSSGHVTKGPEFGFCGDGFLRLRTTMPGGELDYSDLAMAFCAIKSPGIYVFKTSAISPVFTGDGSSGAQGASLPPTITCTIPVIVEPYDAGKMSRVCSEYGRQVLAGMDPAGEAISILSHVDDPEAVPWLAQILQMPNPETESQAMDGLARIGTPASLTIVFNLFTSNDGRLALSAERSLARVVFPGSASNSSSTRLIESEMLKDAALSDPTVRAAAVDVLGSTHDHAMLQTIITATHDPDEQVRLSAARALGDLNDLRGAKTAVNGLKSPDYAYRMACAYAAWELNKPVNLKWLLPIVRSVTQNNTELPTEAMDFIAENEGAKAAPALAGCLKFTDPTPGVNYNWYILEGLQSCSDKKAFPEGSNLLDEWSSDANPNDPVAAAKSNQDLLNKIKACFGSD